MNVHSQRRSALLSHLSAPLLIASLLASLLTACASAGSSTVGGSSTGGSCNLSYVNAQIAAHERVPTFTPPGPSFDAKKAAGKTIFTIQETTANPFTENIVAAMKRVADQIGIHLINYPNQGQHSQWAQGIDTAIAEKVDAIVLVGGTIGPKYFVPQAQAAQQAGIPIITVVDTDLSQPPEAYTNARVAQPYVQAAKLDADWIISQTHCKADVLVLTSNELIAGDVNSVAAQKEFSTYCGSGCQVKFVNVPVPEWSTRIQPTVQSAIQADPNLNYIFPLYDAMSQFVLPGIQLAGASGRVHVASFNGTPFVLGYIQNGNVDGAMTMDVGESEDWLGYAAMDQTMRILTGVPPISSGDEHIPLRVFDKSNADDAGVPPQFGKGYGNEWLTGYERMWGLSS
jgi:ribose transport system substrate-binding protein